MDLRERIASLMSQVRPELRSWPVLGSAAAATPRASARLNLRVPPGTQAGDAAQALVSHLQAVAPWRCT
jgi:hypothetical protein